MTPAAPRSGSSGPPRAAAEVSVDTCGQRLRHPARRLLRGRLSVRSLPVAQQRRRQRQVAVAAEQARASPRSPVPSTGSPSTARAVPRAAVRLHLHAPPAERRLRLAATRFPAPLGWYWPGSTRLATKQSGEPDHAGDPGGHSVWYSWTPTKSAVGRSSTSAPASFDPAARRLHRLGARRPAAPVPTSDAGSRSNATRGGASGSTRSLGHLLPVRRRWHSGGHGPFRTPPAARGGDPSRAQHRQRRRRILLGQLVPHGVSSAPRPAAMISAREPRSPSTPNRLPARPSPAGPAAARGSGGLQGDAEIRRQRHRDLRLSSRRAAVREAERRRPLSPQTPAPGSLTPPTKPLQVQARLQEAHVHGKQRCGAEAPPPASLSIVGWRSSISSASRPRWSRPGWAAG